MEPLLNKPRIKGPFAAAVFLQLPRVLQQTGTCPLHTSGIWVDCLNDRHSARVCDARTPFQPRWRRSIHRSDWLLCVHRVWKQASRSTPDSLVSEININCIHTWDAQQHTTHTMRSPRGAIIIPSESNDMKWFVSWLYHWLYMSLQVL